jgi:hypothetical protein
LPSGSGWHETRANYEEDDDGKWTNELSANVYDGINQKHVETMSFFCLLVVVAKNIKRKRDDEKEKKKN